MTVIDTSVWIDALRDRVNPQTQWLAQRLEYEEIALTDLILCEVLQGVRDVKAFRPFREDLFRFPIHDTGGVDMAAASADNFQRLRDKGITVRSTIDCIIATFCIRENHRLLHRDRDYDGFEQHLGLQVVHPQA